jgi:hypothetical protein
MRDGLAFAERKLLRYVRIIHYAEGSFSFTQSRACLTDENFHQKFIVERYAKFPKEAHQTYHGISPKNGPDR